MKLRLLALALAGLLIGADDPKIEAKRDMARLQGHWAFVSIEEDGHKIPAEQMKSRTGQVMWVFTGDKLSLLLGGEKSAGSFRLDAGQTPRAMDIKDCFAKGTTVQCIYEWNKGQLRICVGNRKGGERPGSFDAKAKSGRSLYVLKSVPPPRNDDD
jgi:uncharacterized protein (TIGR03067 family)